MRQQQQSRLLVMIAAIFTTFLTYVSMSRFGPGLSPDSTEYIFMAKEILSNGFAFLFENKAVSHPPVYPMIIAGLSWITGISEMDSAVWINVFSSTGIVILTLATIVRITSSVPALIVMALLAVLSVPLREVWVMAWSESICFLLTAIIFWMVGSPFRNLFYSAFIPGLLAGLAILSRYAAVILVPWVALYLFIDQTGSFWRRLVRPVVFALLPTLMFLTYIYRNLAISGTTTGVRHPSPRTFLHNLDIASDVVLKWFLPEQLYPYKYAILILLLLGSVSCLWIKRARVKEVFKDTDSNFVLWGGFAFFYFIFILWSATSTAFDELDDRLLSPIYPSILVIMAFWMKTFPARKKLSQITLTLIVLFFLVQLAKFHFWQTKNFLTYGTGGYNTIDWHESSLINYLRKNSLVKEKVFSNLPDALYILAQLHASMSPAKKGYNSEMSTGVNAENVFEKYPGLDESRLVWFKSTWRDYLYSIEELNHFFNLEMIQEFPDGAIYKISDPQKK